MTMLVFKTFLFSAGSILPTSAANGVVLQAVKTVGINMKAPNAGDKVRQECLSMTVQRDALVQHKQQRVFLMHLLLADEQQT